MFGKKKKITMPKLNKFNKIMAVLHAVQALVIVVIATDFKLPVTTNYIRYNAETDNFISESTKLFDLPFAWLVISFLVMSSLAHLIISTVYRKKYESNLRKGITTRVGLNIQSVLAL